MENRAPINPELQVSSKAASSTGSGRAWRQSDVAGAGQEVGVIGFIGTGYEISLI
jgi:hypothetical protein